jgi:6-pyruvoyltetrahydropterin/6-carboxytetrahydropterin synthase
LHGHTYAVEITVAGPLGNGLVIDTGDLDVCMGPVIARLDHRYLNELAEHGGAEAVLAQPTVENIVAYLCEALRFMRRESTMAFQLVNVRVYENDRTWAEAAPEWAESREAEGRRET